MQFISAKSKFCLIISKKKRIIFSMREKATVAVFSAASSNQQSIDVVNSSSTFDVEATLKMIVPN